MFLVAVAILALGLSEPAEDCIECQQTTLLQHGLRITSAQLDATQLTRFNFLTRHSHNSAAIPASLDANGRVCFLCNSPPAERAPNKTYVQRTDCGNHSVFEHPETLLVPLSEFRQEATDEHNESFAWCELNLEKGCADAIYNADYMMFAKSIQMPDLPIVHYSAASWDQHYCFYNGWLTDEIRSLQHDFQGMRDKGQEFCNSEAMVRRGSKGNMTLSDMLGPYMSGRPGFPGAQPTLEAALLVGAWACAMGSAACDMAYCAYSYCRKGYGFGTYAECPGWDPVYGMPVEA